MGVFRLPISRRPIPVLSAIEQFPWTHNWDHLLPVRRPVLKRSKLRNPNIPEPVPTRERIRQWNIVPGDRIRVRGEEGGTIREVFGINRFRNLVYLKARQETGASKDKPATPPSVSYARCQLYVGDREFPPSLGELKPRVAPVFASRIGYTAPKYLVNLGRFEWERFAVQTIPRLGDRDEKIKIPIPWPKSHTPPIPAIDVYDTPADVAQEITWRPSHLLYPPSSRAKVQLLQDSYLHSIRPPHGSLPASEYDTEKSPAIEYVLGHELSNPHSRAKKQRRLSDRVRSLRVAHERFLRTELANLDGRTRKETLVEAEWKWTELCRRDKQANLKRQWMLRGNATRLKRKRQRKERKQRREIERMKNLVLDPAPNQILPNTRV